MTDEINRTLPDGTIFQDKPKLRYCEEGIQMAALNEALGDDGELLTIAWMDGMHRSNKAHREWVKELEAENERLTARVAELEGTGTDLYMAGRWSCDQPVDEAAQQSAIVEAVAELQLSAFLAGRCSMRADRAAPSMDDFRRMARSAIERGEHKEQG